MLVCAFFCTFARETSGAARTRYSLRPLIKRVRKFLAKLGRKCAAGPLAHAGIPCRGIALGVFGGQDACQGSPERRENASERETPAENDLSIKGKAYLAGIYEHPTRHAPDKSTAQLHAEVARGALADAGLTKADIDGYFCAGDAPGGVMAMADYMGLKVRHLDSTDTGGCSYLIHLGHAAEAIAAGKCSIALITLAGKPRTGVMPPRATGAEADFEAAYTATTHNIYAMCAMRHMHEFGTTSEQLAWIKVAASHHAQYNEHAMLRDVVTVEDVINSPMISDPLHRMDCCVVTDGGGALIVTTEAIARSLKKPLVRMIGHGEALKGPRGGKDLNLTYSP